VPGREDVPSAILLMKRCEPMQPVFGCGWGVVVGGGGWGAGGRVFWWGGGVGGGGWGGWGVGGGGVVGWGGWRGWWGVSVIGPGDCPKGRGRPQKRAGLTSFGFAN